MHKKQGFTLIELLTVVLILGILTSIAVPQYSKSIQRAEAADALINLKTLFDAGKRYYSLHSTWPTSFTGLDVGFLDAGTTGEVGGFKYSFASNKTASACRLVGNSATSSYCLTAYYKKNIDYDGNGTNETIRDVYTCKDNSGGEYAALCDSLCPSDYTSGECIIESR